MEKGKRGRPRGKQARTTKKWEPKNWKPVYDRIVGYSVLGKSNIEIAELVNKTKEQVSNVLNTDQGRELYNKLQLKIKGTVENDLITQLTEIGEQSVRNVHKIVHDPELIERYPFRVAAVGIDVLKGLGHLKTGPNVLVNNQVAFGLPTDLQEQLMEGLAKADRVKKLHSGEKLGVELGNLKIEKEDAA